MKRFVYIPEHLYSGVIPEEALRIARESHLQIRIGELDDGICANDIGIVSIPEISRCDSQRYARIGHVFEVDATNEFIVFPRSTVLRIIYDGHEEQFTPKIREKHSVRFRPRLTRAGSAEYRIEVDNNEIVYSGVVEIR